MEALFDVIIETPKGSRNKYVYNPKKEVFKLKKTLPQGSVFPFDFGFIPKTEAGDGDPVDVLVIMDEPAYPGVVVKCRIIGAIKAIQRKEDKWERNNRIIAVYSKSDMYADLKDITDMNAQVVSEIEHFFMSYIEQEGKIFKVQGRAGAEEALELIKKSKK
jgi:inorganic pyrophosphatase